MDAKSRTTLDSFEKILYSKYYNNPQYERKVAKPKPVVKKRAVTINECLDKYWDQDKTCRKTNLKHIEHIRNYVNKYKVKLSKGDLEKTVISNNKTKGVSWNNQIITKEFSENAKVRNTDKRMQMVGPGTYSLLGKTFNSNVTHQSTFGTTKRFHPKETKEVTGLGSFGITDKVKKPSSVRPSFEWSPPRPKDKVPDYHLAPTTYSQNDRTISSFINRKVTMRGPYDCFTGPRDMTTIKNHFSLPSIDYTGPWPISLPSTMETNKYKNGYLGKTKRFMSKTKITTIPDPASYQREVTQSKTYKQNKYPFNCSSASPRKLHTMIRHTPGPGRYYIEETLQPIIRRKSSIESETPEQEVTED